MSDFAEFLQFIGKVFVEILKLTFDIVCLAVFFCSFVAPWRIPWIIWAMLNIDDRDDYRAQCWGQFGISLIDLICVPLGLVSLAGVWRIIPFIQALFSDHDDGSDDFKWNYEVRGKMFANFWIVVSDIPCIAAALIVNATLWRMPQFWRMMADAWKEDDSVLYIDYNGGYRAAPLINFFILLTDIPCFICAIFVTFTGLRTYQFYSKLNEKWGKQDDDIYYNHRHRVNALRYFCEVTIDVIFVPLFFVIFVTIYRVPILFSKMKAEKGMKKRWVCIKQFFLVLWDLPFIIVGFIVFITVWRAPRLWADLHDPDWNAQQKRARVFVQFGLLIRDIPFFIMFFIIIGTLYRMLGTVMKLLQLRSKPLDGASKITVRSVQVFFPDKGGCRLDFVAKKPPGLTVRNSKLFVLGPSFWDTLKSQIGDNMTLIAQNMLPLKLSEAYFDPHSFVVGEEEVRFSYTFNYTQAKKSTLLKKFGRMNQQAQMLFHVEFPYQEGDKTENCILFAIPVNVYQILDSVNKEETIDFDDDYVKNQATQIRGQSENKPFQDAFWAIVLTDFAEIVLDIAHLLMFFLSAIAPWRFLALLVVLFEPKERWSLRVYKKIVDMTRMTRYMRTQFYEKFQDQADIYLKEFSSNGFRALTDDCDEGRTYRHHRQPYKYWTKFLLSGAGGQKYDRGLFPILNEYVRKEQDEMFWRSLAVQLYVTHIHGYHVGFDENALQLTQDEYKTLVKQTEKQVNKAAENVAEQQRELLNKKNEISTECRGCRIKCSSICKRGNDEKRKIIQAMFIGAMSDIFSIGLLLILVCTLYRAIPTLKDFFKASLWEWKRIVIAHHFRQMMLDVLMIIRIVFVLATVYKMLDLLLDLFNEAEKRSLSGARKVAKNYVRRIFEDLWEFFSLVFVWKFYKFGVAITVWGIFVPAACLSELLCTFIPDSIKKVRRTFAVLFWFALFAFPFIFVLFIVPKNVDTSGVVAQENTLLQLRTWVFGYFAIVFLIIFLSLFATSRDSDNVKIKNPTTTVSASMQNLHALVMIILDTFQLIGLIFISIQLQQGQNGSIGLNDSSSVFNFFVRVSEVLFFVFDGAFEAVVWFCVGLVGLWYIIICLPIVVEDLLEWQDKGNFQKSTIWNFCASMLSSTLYMIILANLLKPIQCFPGEDLSATSLFVRFDPSIECWTPDSIQPTLALTCMVCLIFYLITSTVLSDESGLTQMSDSPKLDVRYPYLYSMGVQSVKVLLTLIVFILVDPSSVMIICMCGAVLLILWSIIFPKAFKSPICSVRWIVVMRYTGMFMFLWATVVGFIELENGKRKIDIIETDALLLSGWGLILFIGLCIGYKRKWQDRRELSQTLASSTIHYAIQELIQKENQVSRERGVLPHWHSINNSWVRTMNNNKHRAVMLAKKTVEFEEHLRYPFLTREFLGQRASWLGIIKGDDLDIIKVEKCITELAKGIIIPEIPIPKLFKKLNISDEEKEEKKQEEVLVETVDVSDREWTHKTTVADFMGAATQELKKTMFTMRDVEYEVKNGYVYEKKKNLPPVMAPQVHVPRKNAIDITEKSFDLLSDEEKFNLQIEVVTLQSDCVSKNLSGLPLGKQKSGEEKMAKNDYFGALNDFNRALEMHDEFEKLKSPWGEGIQLDPVEQRRKSLSSLSSKSDPHDQPGAAVASSRKSSLSEKESSTSSSSSDVSIAIEGQREGDDWNKPPPNHSDEDAENDKSPPDYLSDGDKNELPPVYDDKSVNL